MYTITGRVGTSQTGADGVMKLVSAMDIMQDSSIFWTESVPVFFRHLADNNLGMFLLFRQADVIRLPKYGENISACTWIYKCNGFSGYRNTVLYDEGGRACVKSWSIGGFVSRDTGHMTKLPQEIAEAVTIEPKADMEYLGRKITLPETGWEALSPAPVRRGDIDFNRHVNNVRYIETAMELIPPDYNVKRFRVEFREAAKPGDIFYPSMATYDNNIYIILSSDTGAPYAVIEFS